MIRRFLVLLVAVVLLAPVNGFAVQPDEVLDDPLLETRARAISHNLRCLVCQNQSIDDSDAELARDLRLLVRERLVAGDSDTDVINYIVARYGEFVLLRPVFALHTVLLWIAAPVFLLIGLVVVILGARRKRATAAAASDPKLTAEERKALERLAKD
ncbi:cytochrome c-type biogenesis protein [Pelagibacterium limicola]|uniref:cytochrome c-type biogenesis protein n=1 Tax=Pelagibacterium limicola TaxID=2791022 RepID=UPI0018AF9D4D|nr:cytochrome c-type biogenesis protein [Pelagibacterium limicola]